MKRQRFKHSIQFGDGTLVNGKFVGLDTYEDFHLIPSSRPTISMPGVETKFVTIPGRDGSYDLTNFIRRGNPAYGDRSGTFEFYVENDWDEGARQEEFWMTIYPRMVNALHGKKFKMVLREDDPDYFWEGRFTVDKYDPGDGHHSTVSISYHVGPYKWKIRSGSDMLWDNFNFEKEYDNSMQSGQVTIRNGFLRVDVTGAGADTVLNIGNEAIPLGGRSYMQIVRPVSGTVALSLNGPGTMEWREGSL